MIFSYLFSIMILPPIFIFLQLINALRECFQSSNKGCINCHLNVPQLPQFSGKVKIFIFCFLSCLVYDLTCFLWPELLDSFESQSPRRFYMFYSLGLILVYEYTIDQYTIHRNLLSILAAFSNALVWMI